MNLVNFIWNCKIKGDLSSIDVDADNSIQYKILLETETCYFGQVTLERNLISVIYTPNIGIYQQSMI